MPLVTVKQSDGTYAKITLEEFVRRQKNATTAPATAPQASTSPAPVVAPVSPEVVTAPKETVPAYQSSVVPPPVPKPPVPATAPLPPKPAVIVEEIKKPVVAPVAPAPVIEAPRAVRDSAKNSSTPLVNMTVPSVTDADVDRVVGRLTFTVADEYKQRLRHLVELRLKELRDDEQTKNTAQRSFEEGGLQLSTGQCEELLSLCAVREQLMVPPAQKMAVATPFNSFKHEPAPVVKSVQELVVPSQPLPVPAVPAADMSFADRTKMRPIVTDVTYRPTAVGPIDEIRMLTLTDFRRLSPVPTDAALRLEQKFTNLKGESVVLYLDALDAWRQSALYQEYTDRMLYAILHRTTLDLVLRKTKSITSDELDALIMMEKRLTV